MLRGLRRSRNLTQKELAYEIGISKSAVSMYELGNREPDFGTEEALAKYFDVSIEYLRLGQKKQTAEASIPLIQNSAIGDVLITEENIEEYIYAAHGIVADFALRCSEDSMINARIFRGDIVYFKSLTDYEDGQIVAAVVDDEITIRRIRKYPTKTILQAENPLFHSRVYESERMLDFCILGKAVAILGYIDSAD